MPRPLCKRCRWYPAGRPRGLCHTCYYTPGVREQYPSTSKYARQGSGHGAGPAPLPAAPTPFLPGTPAKVWVLEQRAARREALFHPRDAADRDGERGVPIRPPDKPKAPPLPAGYRPTRNVYRLGGRWRVIVHRAGRSVHVGVFASQQEAVEAARRARAG